MTTTNAQAALMAAAASYAATGRFTTTNEITTRAEDLQAWLDQTDRNNARTNRLIQGKLIAEALKRHGDAS